MKISLKKQQQKKALRKLFLLAWCIKNDKKITFSTALHSAWVVYKNKNLILPFLTTPSKSVRLFAPKYPVQLFG